MNQRLNRLNRIAKSLDREDIWTADHERAFQDNIATDLELVRNAILDMKIERVGLN